MTDPNLDLSLYDEAVAEHLLFGLARMRALADRVGGKAWSVDLVAGEITFAEVGTFPVHILGSWAHDSDTFLWSWANPGSRDWGGSLGAATALRARGENEPGLAAFRVPKISPQWVHPLELALVAGELSDRMPLYAPEVGQAHALLLVAGTGLDAFEPDAISIGSLLAEATQYTFLPARRFVEPFLRRLRFTLESSPSVTRATREGRRFELQWDGAGRLLQMNAKLSGA